MWGGPPDIDTYEAAIARYMGLYPDVEIELIDAAGRGASYAACKTLIAGGTMADVFVPGSWNYNAMANDGVLEDLGPLIEADMDLDLSDFHPVTIEAVSSLSDGTVVGLPMGFNIQSMWYNKDMFDAAGLGYPPADGDYTWDDVRVWAKQLTIDENGNTADSMDFDPSKIMQWGYYNHFVWPWGNGYDPILVSFGGSTMTLPDRQTCNLEHPDSIRAWQFIQDLMWTDHSTVKPDAHAEQIGFLRWVGGQVALQHGSFEQAKLVDDQNPGLNYDIAPLPMGDAGNATVIQVHMWSIYSGSPNKELAWHLLRWLATEGSVGDYGSIMTLIPRLQGFRTRLILCGCLVRARAHQRGSTRSAGMGFDDLPQHVQREDRPDTRIRRLWRCPVEDPQQQEFGGGRAERHLCASGCCDARVAPVLHTNLTFSRSVAFLTDAAGRLAKNDSQCRISRASF